MLATENFTKMNKKILRELLTQQELQMSKGTRTQLTVKYVRAVAPGVLASGSPGTC